MWKLTRRLTMAGLLAMLLPVAVLGEGAVESPAPEVLAELPWLEQEMPWRNMADVPLFAGPATLKVSGKRGAYRWQHVLFGTGEVSARVSLVGEGGPCLVRLRLIEDGEAIADMWFESLSEARDEHQATLAVDYASTRLKVDSDCRAWSVRLKPLGDPGLEHTIKEITYPVHGDSIDELVTGTQHIEGRWAAYAEWFTSWMYSMEEDEAHCRVGNGRTELDATITFPDWRRPRSVDATVAAEWEDFMANLRTHEEGHLTIALQGASAIDDRLDEGFTASTCDVAVAQAEAAARDILQRYNRRSERYDDRTSHGASQGATLG